MARVYSIANASKTIERPAEEATPEYESYIYDQSQRFKRDLKDEKAILFMANYVSCRHSSQCQYNKLQ
jgi:hypothetical protein